MIIVKIQDSQTGKGKRWRTIGMRQSESGLFTPIAIDEIPAKGGVRRYIRFLAASPMPLLGGGGIIITTKQLPKREQLKRLKAHSKRMYDILESGKPKGIK